MAIATNTTLGDIQLAGDLAGSNNGLAPELTAVADLAPGNTNPAGSYSLPVFSVDAKGRILTATSGTPEELLPIIPDASTAVKGKVQIGQNIQVAGGVISVPIATTSVPGVVRPDGTSVAVDSQGRISVDPNNIPVASDTRLGIVRIQPGGGISVTDGVISVDTPPIASGVQRGILQAGPFIQASENGELSVGKATSSDFGVIKAGYGLKVVDGVLEIDQDAIADEDTYGLLRVGENIELGPNGFRPALQKASASTLGVVRVGAGLAIDGDGILSNTLVTDPPIASPSELGLVQIGAGINVADGVISVPIATTGAAGAVRIGTVGLTVSPSGEVNAVSATNSTLGVVRPGNTADLTIDGDFRLRVGTNIPKKNTANTFTKAQTTALVDLGNRSGTVVLDLSASNVQMMTLTGNVTLAAPTNAVPGGVFHIIVKQTSGGNRLVIFNSVFKQDQLLAYIDPRPNKTTILTLVVIDSATILTTAVGGF